jgi:AbrB family looped-hinge helix DNA binding protein
MAHIEQVTVGDRGRLVLPARVRQSLDLHPGSHLALTMESDGSLRLRPYRAIAEQARGLWADLAPASVSMSDELIAERHAEAAREDAA